MYIPSVIALIAAILLPMAVCAEDQKPIPVKDSFEPRVEIFDIQSNLPAKLKNTGHIQAILKDPRMAKIKFALVNHAIEDGSFQISRLELTSCRNYRREYGAEKDTAVVKFKVTKHAVFAGEEIDLKDELESVSCKELIHAFNTKVIEYRMMKEKILEQWGLK